ncbi:MAG: ectoine hydroxylase [Halioglobus sp.]|jgi:ectoine hydroxylase
MSLKVSKPATETDNYPSRQPGQVAGAIPRLEPVVYADSESQAPVALALIERYRKQGFMIFDQLFSANEVVAWQEELDCLRHDEQMKNRDETISEPGSREVRSIFAVHKLSRLIDRLSRDSRLLRLAEYLLNDRVYLHQSRLNYKSGFRGKEFYWHSDFETWHVEDGMPAMRALSMSITLTDNYSTNGPLLLIPGSHKEYAACEGETPEEHFKSSLKQQCYGVPDDANIKRLVEQNGIVEFIGKPGSVCLFDCNILHGSNSNISPHPRSNIFFVYNAIGNRVVEPFSGQPPRPEYICTRGSITPINATQEEQSNEQH